MRAKAAIYAGFTVLAQSVGIDLADVSKMLIGGSFGQYINVEKAVQIACCRTLPAPPGSCITVGPLSLHGQHLDSRRLHGIASAAMCGLT